VNQIVSLCHILRDAEAVDQAVYQLLVGDRLAKVVQLSPNPVEVVQITSQGVARLYGAVQFSLQGLNVVQGIVLVGVCQSSECCCARLLLVAPCGSSYHIGCVLILDYGSQEFGERELVMEQPVAVFTFEHVPEEWVMVHQVGLQ
jgi:hypothetical protein